MRNKVLFIILIVTGTTEVMAQKSSSYTQLADSVFKNLNKSYITTGILYDRVYPSAMLHVFNTSYADTSDVYHFNQAYYELYNAAYNKATMVKPDTADRRIEASTTTGKVPIGIINFNFNQIDTNSIINNLLQNRNGLFLILPNRSHTPYWKKQVSIISPLIDSIDGLHVNFQTSPLFFLKNTGHTITSLRVDFNNGSGLTTIGLNNTISINYSSYGKKIIKFIIKYQDDMQVITYGQIKLVRQKSLASRALATNCDRDDTITASIPFTDYENNSFRGKGNIHYYFSTSTVCNGRVKKPIIILDGFDPGDKRPINQLYDVFLNNPDRYKFADEMRSKGYDIVILNFPVYTNEFGKTIDGGADYIERNAFVLVRLINKLNWQLRTNGSTEKLVIIGPSMGGMISRYALAYMEKHNMPHNTRLWISLDAPHNGANIPIGAQKYIEFFANNGNKGANETLQKELNNPAAKEQLLHHYLSYSNLAKGAPGFRDRFALALTSNGVAGSNGFPLIPRRVALVDGSLSGDLLPGSLPCQMVLNSKTYLIVNVFLLKVQLFRVANASIYFAGSYGNECTVLEASQVLKSSVTARGTAPVASISYDVAPGGSRSSFSTLADKGQGYSQFFKFLLELGSSTNFTVYNGSHSFVPTKSALAFKGTNNDLAESVYDRNLVCTGETPFNTYYGGRKNLEHSYIDTPMARFAIDEITGKHRSPSYITTLPSVYISGPDNFCEPGGIYSLQGGKISSGTSLAWSVSPAIANISSGNNSTQVQLSKISSGTATLSLQLNKTCGLRQTITKTFSIGGYSSSDYPISGPSSATNNQYVYFSTSQLPGATNYSWFWPGNWTYVSGQGTNSVVLRTGYYSGLVGVRVANACDPGGSPATTYVQVYDFAFVMNAAPNPTNGEVTITTNSQSLQSTFANQNKIYQLEVTDIFGNIKKKFSYSSGETNITVNLSTLISGTYIIHAYNGKAWTYKKIVLAR